MPKQLSRLPGRSFHDRRPSPQFPFRTVRRIRPVRFRCMHAVRACTCMAAYKFQCIFSDHLDAAARRGAHSRPARDQMDRPLVTSRQRAPLLPTSLRLLVLEKKSEFNLVDNACPYNCMHAVRACTCMAAYKFQCIFVGQNSLFFSNTSSLRLVGSRGARCRDFTSGRSI